MRSNITSVNLSEHGVSDVEKDSAREASAKRKEQPVPHKGIFKKLFSPKAVQSGEYFGTPGAGDSRMISFFSTLFFLALWTFVTEGGYIKPMFLPSPIDVVGQIGSLITDGFAGATLAQHLGASLSRIFGAFLLACVLGIPLESDVDFPCYVSAYSVKCASRGYRCTY